MSYKSPVTQTKMHAGRYHASNASSRRKIDFRVNGCVVDGVLSTPEQTGLRLELLPFELQRIDLKPLLAGNNGL